MAIPEHKPMLVIPAIDLSEGKAVRLRRGDMAAKTVYGEPVDFALRWQAAGALLIHLVDLDGAIAGRPANLPAVEQIIAAIEIPVELGGGLRTAADVARVLELGVGYSIMGTSALYDRSALAECVQRFGEQIIVGIDARDGKVAVKGWVEGSHVQAIELARQVEALGVRRIIFTDIATDGMLQGPNLPAIRRMAEAVQMEVVASGGITTIDDLLKLKELEDLGVIGAIVGRALYEGDIKLAEAIAKVS